MGGADSTHPIERRTTPQPTVLPGNPVTVAEVLEKPHEPLWYLAYGSNLYSGVFKKRRRIKPLDERHVLVEGLELTFDLPGLPYLEPRFANCRLVPNVLTHSNGDLTVYGEEEKKCDRVFQRSCIDCNAPWTGIDALIGVAYLVSPEDFARIIKTEGGGSGYKMVSVEGKVFRRKVASGELREEYILTGERIHAFTLLAPEEATRKSPGQPSLRYLSLIRKGAEEHKLPPCYLAYLDSLTPYSARTIRQRLGAVVAIGLGVPLLIPTLVLGFIFARKDGYNPNWLIRVRRMTASLIWTIHDNWMIGLFGDGEKTEEGWTIDTAVKC